MNRARVERQRERAGETLGIQERCENFLRRRSDDLVSDAAYILTPIELEGERTGDGPTLFDTAPFVRRQRLLFRETAAGLTCPFLRREGPGIVRAGPSRSDRRRGGGPCLNSLIEDIARRSLDRGPRTRCAPQPNEGQRDDRSNRKTGHQSSSYAAIPRSPPQNTMNDQCDNR